LIETPTCGMYNTDDCQWQSKNPPVSLQQKIMSRIDGYQRL